MRVGTNVQGPPVATRGAFVVEWFGRTMTGAHRQSAISLGELGAVIAVTGIVVGLAYSAYHTYQVRREVSEGLTTASELIPLVTELFRRNGEVPAQLETPQHLSAALSSSSVVESVNVVDGRIDILYSATASPAIAGQRISLTPYETVERHVVWLCGNRMPGAGLEPLGFASGGRQALQLATTIEARYLSQPCR